MMAEMWTDMATKKKRVKAIIQLRRATESQWIDKNPILREGEPAFSIDKMMFKIGNGTAHWSELPYIPRTITSDITEILENYRVEDLLDGKDYATIDYVNEVVDGMYVAGNGIVIEDREVRLDDLILDCGTSTTNI